MLLGLLVPRALELGLWSRAFAGDSCLLPPALVVEPGAIGIPPPFTTEGFFFVYRNSYKRCRVDGATGIVGLDVELRAGLLIVSLNPWIAPELAATKLAVFLRAASF